MQLRFVISTTRTFRFVSFFLRCGATVIPMSMYMCISTKIQCTLEKYTPHFVLFMTWWIIDPSTSPSPAPKSVSNPFDEIHRVTHLDQPTLVLLLPRTVPSERDLEVDIGPFFLQGISRRSLLLRVSTLILSRGSRGSLSGLQDRRPGETNEVSSRRNNKVIYTHIISPLNDHTRNMSTRRSPSNNLSLEHEK